MQETVVHIFNSKEEPVDVWFEPWASALLLKPNAQFRLVARSEREGELQIDYLPGRIMVYGWPGCTVQVYSGEELVYDFNIKFPDIPPGMTMKDFVTLMFGEQPPSAESKAKLN